MTDRSSFMSLIGAVERYLDLMFDNDIARFDEVFAPTAQLHGLRKGSVMLLTAGDYKDILAGTPSPKAKSAPREQEILLIDFASPAQALVKVRVRIDRIVYVDYLSFHLGGEGWRITAKSFHVERKLEAAS